MSTFLKQQTKYLLRYYKHFIDNFDCLSTFAGCLYFIEFFAQYLLVYYSETYNKKPDLNICGGQTVYKVSASKLIMSIVDFRNSVVHCGYDNFDKTISTLLNSDYTQYPEKSDEFIRKGLDLLSTVDWKGLESFLLEGLDDVDRE